MAKVSLTDITGGYQSVAVYNANNQLIEDEFDNCLSRDGTAPNSMGANIDMNSNRVTNLADGTNQQDAVTVAQLNAASVVVSTVAASAVTVADAGGLLAADTVEGALAEIAAEVDANTAQVATNVSDIATNTADIGTNTADIATNVADIATNTADIATNAADIATLQTAVGTVVWKYKTADESVTSSTTLQDDNDFTNIAVAANGVYVIEGYLDYTQSVGDLKLAFTYTTSPSVRSYSIYAVAEDGTSDEDTDNGGNDLILTTLTDGQDIAAVIRGHLTVSGSSGTGKLQWAQNTSDASPTTIRKGSWLKFTRIA